VNPAPATHAIVSHAPPALRWIIGLGGLGLFAVSVVDSSIIPLPVPGSTDLLLLLLVAHRADAILMASAAIVGSVIGGYLTFTAGVKGGEAAIQRYFRQRYIPRVSDWVENHGPTAVIISSLLPPPLPILPFLFAAGALGVPRTKFLISYGTARSIRYSLEAWIAATYGRRILHVWHRYLENWATPVLLSFLALVLAGILFGVWRWKRTQQAMAPASFSRS
jgi:membrane protein YqaA with SNARE-associated domain